MKTFLTGSRARVSAWLFGAAIVTLTWRLGIATPPVKLFEVLILLLLGWQVLAAVSGASSPAAAVALRRTARATAPWWGLLFFGAALGWLWSIAAIPAARGYFLVAALEYGRMLFAAMLFGLVVHVVVTVGGGVRRWLWLIMLASLSLFPALYPGWREYFFGFDDFRLRGPGSDPNYMGSWLALGATIAAGFCFSLRRYRALAVMGLVGSAALLIMTISRTALLAVFAGIGIVAIIAIFQRKKPHRAWLAAGVVIFLAIGFISGFALAPITTRAGITHRLIVPFLGKDAGQAVSANPSLSEIARNLGNFSSSVSGPEDGRLALWRRGGELFFTHPLGLGPAYYHWQPLGATADGKPLASHNLFLETALTAGWLGLIGLGGLLWFLGRQAALIYRKPDGPTLVGCLVVLLITSLFLDTLTLRWLWVIAGLTVVAGMEKPDSDTITP